MKTKGQIEAAISKSVVKIIKECLCRGPTDIRTYIIEDFIVIREKNVLVPVEQRLLTDGDRGVGRTLVKQIRELLHEKCRKSFENAIKQITRRNVVSLHTDVSTKTGELLVVFTLDGPVEFKAVDNDLHSRFPNEATHSG